jgi:hypothetical protein
MKVGSVTVPDECPHKTLDSLMKAILPIIPSAIFEEDNDGQLIIYTDLEVKNGLVY